MKEYFVGYLMTLSVSNTAQLWVVGWLIDSWGASKDTEPKGRRHIKVRYLELAGSVWKKQ